MECDFQGYATKANVQCTDGRVITTDAFKHQHQTRVPLVWQHGHSDPKNVVGYALLENRPDGVYTYGFFNETENAAHMALALAHGDINMMSIHANSLVERSKQVMHGNIKEVSLVLAGANPGAIIEAVHIRHSDGSEDELEDEARILPGDLVEVNPELLHADDDEENDDDDDEETIAEIYEDMTPKQQKVVHYLVGEALSGAGKEKTVTQSDDTKNELGDPATDPSTEGNENMTKTLQHNVFEGSQGSEGKVLSHEDQQAIFADAKTKNSFKAAINDYALEHGITNIDQLFPQAQNVSDVPEWVKRRTEWVDALLSDVRKSPFARVRTLSADLSFEDARAKGYIKGSMKKEEFFAVASRTTTPTTIYKKQKLDRDDIIDITDFDVIAWLKAEMRIMLDEELARAILLGDGRDPASTDKINEGNIRPIAKDSDLYTSVLPVNITDANSSTLEVIDAIVGNRHIYKGSGLPIMFVSDQWIAKFMLLRDADGRRLYRAMTELAEELRVSKIVPVEPMSEYSDLIAVLVNPVDYVLGATKGGEVNMFDQFDIDYNQQKYLIETRCSGALVKIKSAMVVKSTLSTDVEAIPSTPTFVATTGVITIPTVTGVQYRADSATGSVLSPGAQAAIAAGATKVIYATPAAGYYFSGGSSTFYDFTRN